VEKDQGSESKGKNDGAEGDEMEKKSENEKDESHQTD
jgi:hypothetical protein